MGAGKAQVDVYIETGQKRVIGAAINWPGWCRRGGDEASALAALLQAAPRYAEIVRPANLSFPEPDDLAQLVVRERVAGNASADMGIPDAVLNRDKEPMDEAEVDRSVKVLRACWAAFDRTVAAARGKELRKGPRGGGRDLDAIVRHVMEAEAGYAERVGLKFKWSELVQTPDLDEALAASREKVLEGLKAVAPIGVPPPGPRGGARWPARYFVRRVAYHVVDHTWEIEDRVQPSE